MLLFVLGCALPARAQGTSIDVSKLYWWDATPTQRSAWTVGSGAPSGGSTGDVYVDYATGDLYTKLAGGWEKMPRLSAALNTYTGTQLIANTEPVLMFNETDQGANLKQLRLDLQGGVLSVQTLNDANVLLATILTLSRAGALAIASGLTATTGTFSGGVTATTAALSSTLDVTGLATFATHVLPLNTDTSDLGRYDRLWNQAYISQINALVFAKTTQTLFGGYSTVGKNAGSFAADVVSAATTANFGQSMTVGNFVLVRAHDTSGVIRAEYMTIGSLVSGTTYNVTRDLAAANSPDPTWASGTPFLVLGASGDGRIDMFAYDGKPRISFVTQGATYNAQTDRAIIGNMNGYYGYATDIYGAAFGTAAAENVTIDPTNGFRVRSGTTTYAQMSGTTFTLGLPAGNRVAWDGTNLTVASANVTIDSNGVVLGNVASTLSAQAQYKFSPTLGGSGASGDVFGLVGFSGGSCAGSTCSSEGGSRTLYVQNVIVPSSPTGYTAIGRVTLAARGWGFNVAAHTASIALASGCGLFDCPDATIDIAAADGISVTGRLTTSSTVRTGTAADATSYTQSNANLLASNTIETFAVAGASTTGNTNYYLFGLAQRRATLQWSTVGTNGGQFAFFTKSDGDADVTAKVNIYLGLVVGAPTGLDKGIGTINAQAVYDDNVLLTDWVFEAAYQGQPAAPGPSGRPRRLYTLDEVKRATADEHRLPWMPTPGEFDSERHVGGMLTRIWQGQEQQQLYIFDLLDRIAALERSVAAIKGGK